MWNDRSLCDGSSGSVSVSAASAAPATGNRGKMRARSDHITLVFLTNFIPPYRIPVLERVANVVPDFRVLVSVPMEANRSWRSDTGNLHVIRQRTVSFRIRHRYRGGVVDEGYLHVPYDTLPMLWRMRPKAILTGEMGFRTVQAILYRKLVGRRVRLVVHADLAESTEAHRGTLRQWFRRWIVRSVDGLIVNGESGKRYIRSLGADERKIAVVPYTTDVSAFASQGSKDTSVDESSVRKLVYCGQLIERKGLMEFADVLIAWARTHPDRSVTWTLVGDGPLSDRLRNLETPPNLAMRFLGAIPYEQIPQLYADQDILVLPTFADTWGLVVNEAMATGLPVLGSRYSQAVEELVEDGVTGWTFYPDNPQEAYRVLDAALKASLKQLTVMGTRARERALSLSPQVVAQQLLDAIFPEFKQ